MADLFDQEKYFHRLFKQSREITLLLNSKRHIIDANNAALKQFGYSLEELIQLRLIDLHVSSDTEPDFSAMLEKAINDEPTFGYDVLMTSANGGEFPASLIFSLIYLDDSNDFDINNDRYIIQVGIRNITKRKIVEGSKAFKLLQLQQESKAKSEFMSIMSHEIRTPLHGIISALELIKLDIIPESQIELFRIARMSSESLLVTLDDVLDFSKLGEHKINLESCRFDIISMIDDIVELMAIKASQTLTVSPVITTFIAPDTPQYLIGDPTRLRQILFNFVSNAVKFTKQGMVHIHLVQDYEQQAKEGNIFIRLEVTDTGHGIDESIQKSVFNAFTQADESTTRKFGGTGLGLAICKRVVDLMQGDIGVRSKPGEGATFWITVPLEIELGLPVNSKYFQSLDGCRVLISDNNAYRRVALQQQLEAWSMQVTSFASMAECESWLQQQEKSIHSDIVHIRQVSDVDKDNTLIGEKSRIISSIKTLSLLSMGAVAPVDSEAYLFSPVRTTALSNELCQFYGRENDYNSASDSTIYNTVKDTCRGEILLVDDSETNQHLGEMMLENAGYTVSLAANGIEAVEISEHKLFDVILMDLQMPKMGGLEATRKIRARSKRDQAIPIIAMTADVSSDISKKCYEQGMSAFISKPVKQSTLIEIVKKFTDQNYPHETQAITEKLVLVENTTTPETVLDIAIIESLLLLGKEKIGKLLQLFITETGKRIRSIEQNYKNCDWDIICKESHTLKSSAGSYGAVKLSQVALSLEDVARHENKESCEKIISQLIDVFARSKEELAPYIFMEPTTSNATQEIRILIIDDDKQMVNAIRRSIFRNIPDSTITTVLNSNLLASQLEDFKPHIITVDLCMPGLGGVEIIRYIRSLDLEYTKIMVISGQGKSALAEAREIGADVVLSKPFENTELLENIQKLSNECFSECDI